MALIDCNEGNWEKCMEMKNYKLIHAFPINGEFVVGIYEGSLSEQDILIKYRQRTKDGKWSKIRTPKHIHWAVDILMKMQAEPDKTREFLRFLLRRWNEIEPIKDENEKKKRTNINYLVEKFADELNRYKELSKSGEYSIKFLIVLAELLMMQEKTNREDAYMFKKLLKALEDGEDIFKIVSIATQTQRGR